MSHPSASPHRAVFHLLLAGVASGFTVAATAQQPADAAPGALAQALREGKVDLGFRLRYEGVDDDAAIDNADGLTLRTTLGYTTAGTASKLFARLQVQDVRKLVDDYNDGTLRPTAKTNYALIADPSDTDFLEAYLGFTGLADSTIKIGRQLITYGTAPWHRFIGNVLWRQTWQSHDAVSLENKSLPDTTFRYAYSWNVNRIFTDKAVGARGNFDSNSHLFNAQYAGFKPLAFEAYGYLLDFDNAAASSTATYGVRFSGSHALSEPLNIVYAAEFAIQDERTNNPASVDENYFLGEIGATLKPGAWLNTLTAKFSYELLEGNGTTSFQTPLATLHAYQGWDDRFLTTPADGLEDIYVTLNAVISNFNFTMMYHDFSSDHDGYDFGSEIDLQLTKPITDRFTAGIKYADYDADRNATNITRNGAIARDVSKFWAWVEFRY